MLMILFWKYRVKCKIFTHIKVLCRTTKKNQNHWAVNSYFLKGFPGNFDM